MKSRLNNNYIFIFPLLFMVVFLIHYSLLSPLYNLAIHGDDWKVRVWFKLLGKDVVGDFFRLLGSFSLGWIYQIYHLWLLESIFGFDPVSFYKVNIFLKILASVSIFPLTLVIFKNRLFSVMAVLLFSISYMTVGPFEWVITAGDYLALLFMNIFFLVYYVVISKSLINFRWLFLLSLTLLFTLFFSPMRVFPVLLLPIVVELIIYFKNKQNVHVKNLALNIRGQLIRVISVYWFLLFIIFKPNELIFTLGRVWDFITKFLPSHPDRILIPFQGIGIIILHPLISSKLPFLTTFSSEIDFFIYSVLNNLIISVFTFLIAFLIFKKRKKFIFLMFGLNFLAQMILLLIYTANPTSSIINDPPTYKNIFLGVYLVMLSIVVFWYWFSNHFQNPLTILLWAAPLSALVFIFLTVALGDTSLIFRSSDRYLMIPSFFMTLFICSILVFIVEKAFETKYLVNKIFAGLFLIIFFLPYFNLSSKEISEYFNTRINAGRDNFVQLSLQKSLSESLDSYPFNPNKPVFIYFETDSDLKSTNYLYEALTGSSFLYWFEIDKKQLDNGCIGYLVNDRKTLYSAVTQKDGLKGLTYLGTCMDKGAKIGNAFLSNSWKDVFYGLDNVFAYKYHDKRLTDIRSEILGELNSVDKYSIVQDIQAPN